MIEKLHQIVILSLIIIRFSWAKGDIHPHAEATCPLQFDYHGESTEHHDGWDMYFIVQGEDLPLTTPLYCDTGATYHHVSVNKTLVPKKFKNVLDCTAITFTETRFHVIAPGTQYTDQQLLMNCTIMIDCSPVLSGKRAWVSVTQHMTSLGSNSLFLNVRPELMKKQVSQGLRIMGVCLRPLPQKTEQEPAIEKISMRDGDDSISYTARNYLDEMLALILMIAVVYGGYTFMNYIVRIIVGEDLNEQQSSTLFPTGRDVEQRGGEMMTSLEHVDCAPTIQLDPRCSTPSLDNNNEHFNVLVWNTLLSPEERRAAAAQRAPVQRSRLPENRQMNQQIEEIYMSLGLLSPLQSQSHSQAMRRSILRWPWSQTEGGRHRMHGGGELIRSSMAQEDLLSLPAYDAALLPTYDQAVKSQSDPRFQDQPPSYMEIEESSKLH